MADIHIEDFYKDAARILSQLFNAFPRRSTLYVEDISGPDSPDEYGVHSARHQACFACMLWLAEEGYLRYTDTIRQEAVDQAVLTQKAFLLLSSIESSPVSLEPDVPVAVLEERLTRIAQVRSLLAQGTSTQLARYMQQLFTH